MDQFKTPAELKVTQIEFDALVMVLDGLEKGRLNDIPVEEAFYMPKVLSLNCGTKGCMLGWAWLLSEKKAFDGPGLRAAGDGNPYMCGREFDHRPMLDNLFFPDSDDGDFDCAEVEPENAAKALRNFLTLGDPLWDEAF